MSRISELTQENLRLREANRRLQQTGEALERDKLILKLRAEIVRLKTGNFTIEEWRDICNNLTFEARAMIAGQITISHKQ